MTDARTDRIRETLAPPALHDYWDDVFLTPPGQRRFFDKAFGELRHRLGAPSGATILDAGCGPGRQATRLAGDGWRVHAVDFSAGALELARANIDAAGQSGAVTLGREDLTALTVPDAAYPYVLCWGVLMHVPDISRAIAELCRVVTPGGRVVVSELNGHAPEARMLRAIGRRRGLALERTAAGWERLEQTGSGPLLVRQADIGWLVREFRRNGLLLVDRVTGQVTELYVVAARRLPVATRAIDWVNLKLLWSRPAARLALGNILTFERR